ncbi:hypothetical protein AB0K51_17495 [Kitasatospora sp. NPDC049285]|uniref:hypothetical protein n=1 Tax=Kitasatospora sp. NPDC049285 TaxID=3157096 RepID=UPI00342D6055
MLRGLALADALAVSPQGSPSGLESGRSCCRSSLRRKRGEEVVLCWPHDGPAVLRGLALADALAVSPQGSPSGLESGRSCCRSSLRRKRGEEVVLCWPHDGPAMFRGLALADALAVIPRAVSRLELPLL